MNILTIWFIISELCASASVRIKENKADKQFANAEYDKAMKVYIDLAKGLDEDSSGRYDLAYWDSIETYDFNYVRLMYKILKCNSTINKTPLESEYSDFANFISESYSTPYSSRKEKEQLIILANSFKNAKYFDEAVEIYISLFTDFNRFDEEVRLNFIDCCIEENMVNTALRLLKKVKSESEKQDRLNKCYNILSNNVSTCLEIGDTLTISKSIYGCLTQDNQDKCILVRLDSAYKLSNYQTVYYGNNNPSLIEIDTLVSEDFYNQVINFELLIKTQEIKELSRFESRYTEMYYFSLKGVTQSYKIKGFLDFDPELERVIF
jgi:hypothetical protein